MTHEWQAGDFAMVGPITGFFDGHAYFGPITEDGKIRIGALLSLPPAMTPEESAVVEAAERWRTWARERLNCDPHMSPSKESMRMLSAVDALHASRRPKLAPVPALIEALEKKLADPGSAVSSKALRVLIDAVKKEIGR